MTKGKLFSHWPQKALKIRDKKFRSRLSIFAVCVLIAMFLWIVIKLSDSYYTEVEYPVSFDNQTSDRILSAYSDSTLQVGIHAKGFKLLNLKWFNAADKIEFNLNHLSMKPYISSGHYNFYLLTDEMLKDVNKKLEKVSKVRDIIPDTIFLMMDEKGKRKVPVQLVTEVSYKSQFEPYREPEPQPDSIWVTGPKSLVEDIDYIRTETYRANDVDDDISEVLKLIIPDMIQADKQKTTLNINVEEYTEISVNIKVDARMPAGRNLEAKTFPNKVEVSFWVALKDYQKITPGQFTALIDLRKSEIQEEEKALVRITRFPSYVKNIRVKPRYVEYIIRDHE
ncbi:MAG: YbbR-like domain-containing protein [Bacteroidales bacterium]|nr:YbbR-like domain-containing protein [Bacteroidales bacterium]